MRDVLKMIARWFSSCFMLGVMSGALATAPAAANPADLDRSFGRGGHVSVQANPGCIPGCVEFGGSYAHTLALQPGGGIVLGGENVNRFNRPGSPTSPGALVRLWPNGTLDTSFGDRRGIEDTPFRVEHVSTDARGGLAVTGDGGKQGIGVARYTAAGAPAGFYGPQGVRWFPPASDISAVQRDAQGRVLALVDHRQSDGEVVRFLASGKRDPSFGRNGIVRLHPPRDRRERLAEPGTLGPPNAGGVALATQPDGSVIVALAIASYDSSQPSGYDQPRSYLQRLTPSGSVDRTFGRNGLARAASGVGMIAVAPNRHIMLLSTEQSEESSGKRVPIDPPRRSPFTSDEVVVTDYTSAGRVNRDFGRDGIARAALPIHDYYSRVAANAIAFDPAGDAIVAGEHYIQTVDVPAGDAFLVRFTLHGRDCSFGAGGVMVDEQVGGASAVAIQPNGRIVIAGWGGGFMAARYRGRGTPHTCRGEGATKPSRARRG